ncbi:MAG: ABC transporter permease [Clostridiales bacterium]|nr:ABC transporter permease [Clostridiales bacterium]
MNNIAALLRGGLSRSKGVMIMAVAVSLGIVFLLSLIINSSAAEDIGAIKLGVIDRDGSAVSADFKRYLADDLGIELVFSGDVDEMNTALIEKRIAGLIEIPAGFELALTSGSPAPVELTFTDDYANEMFTRGYIDSYMHSLGVVSMVAGGGAASGGGAAALGDMLALAQENVIPVETIEKDDELMKEEMAKSGYRLMLSFFMLFSFIMSISLASMLYSDRSEGTYRRIKAGRVTSFQYISSVAVIGAVLMFLIDGPSFAVYALSGNDPGVPALATAGLLAAFSLFVIAFGMFIGVVMPGFEGIIAVIVAAGSIMPMLGGAWFPLDMAPELFKTLGKATPQYWVFEAVEYWQTGEGNAVGPLIIIVLMAALFFVLAGIRFTSNKGLSPAQV